MTVEILIGNNNVAEEWDELIASSLHGTIFHTWDWLKITEKHTHSKLYPLIGLKGSTSIGLFPLFFQKNGPVRMIFSPPPHAALPYLGPVMPGYETLKQEKKEIIFNEFQNSVEHFITNDLKVQYIHISLPPNLQDPRPFQWSGYTIEQGYDYIIDTSVGAERLLRSLDKRGRQNLNHARKKGITIEIGGKKEYEAILDLMEIRYAQQGKILTASREYYLDIYEAFKQNLKIFVAKVDGEIVTGNIDFHYRDTHYSWIGNPKPNPPISPSPNDLLIWESVLYAHEHGCRYYITINAAGNKRLHSYYASKFDPDLKVHFSVKKNSTFAGSLEKGYSTLIKPVKGVVNQYLFKK
jgi:hypothetical protein